MIIKVTRKDAEDIIPMLTLMGYKRQIHLDVQNYDFWGMVLYSHQTNRMEDTYVICLVNKNMLKDKDVKQLLIEYLI